VALRWLGEAYNHSVFKVAQEVVVVKKLGTLGCVVRSDNLIRAVAFLQ